MMYARLSSGIGCWYLDNFYEYVYKTDTNTDTQTGVFFFPW